MEQFLQDSRDYFASDHSNIQWLMPDAQHCEDILKASHFNEFELAASHIGVIMYILNKHPHWKNVRRENMLCLAMHIFLFSMESFFNIFDTFGMEFLPFFLLSQKKIFTFANHTYHVDFPVCSEDMQLTLMAVQCAALIIAADHPADDDSQDLHWLMDQASRTDNIIADAVKDPSSPTYKHAKARTIAFLGSEIADNIENLNIREYADKMSGDQIMQRMSVCDLAGDDDGNLCDAQNIEQSENCSEPISDQQSIIDMQGEPTPSPKHTKGSLKDRFVGTLGAFGCVLYYLVNMAISILPSVMISESWIFFFVFLAASYIFPLSSIVFWIWGFVCATQGPQNALTTIYYIATVVVWLPFFIGVLKDFIYKMRN